MDKAAKVVKRGSARLRSLGTGNGDLSVCISEQRDVKNAARTFINAQSSATEYQLRWAGSGENQALLDITNQVWELSTHWADTQKVFTDALRDYQRMFELMLEGQRGVDLSNAQLTELQDKHSKMGKEYNKAVKKGSAGRDIGEMKQKLLDVEQQRDIAQLEVNEKVHETEAVKLIRFKQGLLKLSEAYITLGGNCQVIFEAQKQLASLLPDVASNQLSDLKYSGALKAREIVKAAVESTKVESPKTARRKSSQGKRRYSQNQLQSSMMGKTDRDQTDDQTEVKKRDSPAGKGNNKEFLDLPPPYSPSPRNSLEPNGSHQPQLHNAPVTHSDSYHRRRTFPLSTIHGEGQSENRDAHYNHAQHQSIDDPEGVGIDLPYTDDNEETTTSVNDGSNNRNGSNMENLMPRNQLYPNLGDYFPEHQDNERKSMPTINVVEVPTESSFEVKGRRVGRPTKNTFV